jgi:hypothetical protein
VADLEPSRLEKRSGSTAQTEAAKPAPPDDGTASGSLVVLVDAENVRRSLWPNIPKDELEDLCAAWGEAEGHEVAVIWESGESADDRIVREVAELEPPVWVVTSDRELRRRVEPHADRILGGGSFARELRRLR